MSRTRIVGGRYTKTVAGDYKLFSKENIVYNSQDKIAFTGVKDGIIYGEPDKISRDASVVNSIDVTLNLFFDGTQNNKTNTDARVTKNDTYKSQGLFHR